MIRVGLLGSGDVANHIYLPGLKQIDAEGGLQLVAVCDTIEDRVRAAAERYRVPRVYTEYDALLADDDVDLIVNLTPVPYHARMVLRALAAGKHVYTEKPLATTLEEANQIIEAMERAGRVVGCAPVLTVHPETTYLKGLLQANAIGKVCFIRARGSNPGPAWCEDFLTDPTWFYKPGGGGPLFDLAVYPLNLITALMGPAKRITAMSGICVPERQVRSGVKKGQTISVEVDDNTHLILDFGDATFASIDATFCVLSAKGPRTEIYGTRGVINLYATPNEPPMEIYRDEPEAGLRGWMVPQDTYRGSLKPYDPRPDKDRRPWTFADGVRHLARCIEEGKQPLISAYHARHILEITLKALESAQEGRAVELQTTF